MREKGLVVPMSRGKEVKEYIYIEDACIERADLVREIDLGKVKIREYYNYSRTCPQ